MTDRELLELAAKAAGIALKPMQINNVTGPGDDRFIGYMTDPEQWQRGWFSPLTDDGDALRLAVKLAIDVNHGTKIVVAECPTKDIGCAEGYTEGEGVNATRRAIVRAAAEVGKEIK